MRILSVTAQKPDSTGSGVYLTELVKGFEKLGHAQAVVAGITKEDIVSLPESVKFYPVYYGSCAMPFPVAGMSDEMPYESTRYSDMTEEMTLQFRTTFLERIHQVMQEFQPDIILCHHLYFLTSLIRENYPEKKVYGISHGSDLRQVKKNPWQREYIRTQIPKLDGIFALHEEQKMDICTYYECEEEFVKVIGTGYNSAIFRRMDGCEKSSDTLHLIFAGKISEKKGVKSLLRAMAYLKEENVVLKLAGGAGNEREYAEIMELAKACPCEVRFLGKLTQDELARETNQSDVFVLPSFYEGLPLVIIEAMACGAKVVCTDLPGIQPWLNQALPGHGVVFVKPPQMQNEDEPIAESLPAFERELSKAILKAKGQEAVSRDALVKISWDGLCDRLIKLFKWSE
ncbi:MAG: glycosyltransferase family 4 protein [Tyzzerella sp.]|nr:glycosyltransferase family 4 protein [Tyzzerella sp.]